jgi:type IV pilus assembly protein PilO
MSAISVLKAKGKTGDAKQAGGKPAWRSALNLHWAGVGLLGLVNLVVLVQIGLVWQRANNSSVDAMAGQRVQLKTAEIAAQPLRGLDTKLATATAGSDRFYRERLPVSYSEVAGELGVLTKKAGVRLTRVSYMPTEVLAGSDGELTKVRMDATLGGDYRPLVLLINSLERDKIFFVINAVTLTGQENGNVNLRLGLTTYLRPNGAAGTGVSAGKQAVAPVAANGGPAR